MPETDAAEADTNISPTPEQIRAEAAERVAAMSEDEKRELMNYVDGAPVFITFPPDVLANAGFDGGIDEKQEYQTLGGAIQAGRAYLTDGYLGFAVYNQQTKQIEHVEGNFPLQHSFSPEILRLNGLEAEAAAADQELASSDQPQQVDTSINITDETRTLADAFGVDATDTATRRCGGMGSTGRESAGDKPESFDGGMLGEGWMRINEPCSVILSLCRA